MKRMVTILLVTFVVVTLVAACAPKETPAPTEEAPPTAAAPPEKPEEMEAELTVIHWGSEEEKDLVAGWIGQFNQEYPGVKVEQIHVPQNYWDKVAAMFAAGTPPDLMYMGYPEMVFYASEGTLLPLDGYMASDPDMSTDMFFPSLIDAFTYEGQLYGVAKDWNTQVLYYNEALFDAAGVSYPDDSWTWDDVLDAAKKIVADTTGDGVTDQWGFVTDVGMNRVGGWIYGNGGGYLTEDKSACMLDDPASVQALEFLTGMMFEEKVAPSKIELGELSAMDTFASGKAGMYVCGGWRVLSFRSITDFGWDIAPIPLSPNSGTRGTVVDSVSWSIAKESKSPAAAWELLKFFTGEAGQVRMAEGGTATPSMIEYANSEAFLDPTQPPAHRDVLISYTPDEIHYYPTIPDMGKMWDAWGQELSEMWLGQKSVQDSVQAFCTRIAPALPGAPPGPEAKPVEGDLTVIHWGSEEEKDLVAGWIAQFNEGYPDVEVEQIHVPQNYWDKVAAMFAAGTPPDLMYMGYPEMVFYASEGTLLPLDDYFARDPEMSTDMFFPSLIDAFTYEGQLYGISKDWNTQVLYYNEALFDAAGVSYPDENWTWDDVLDAAKKIVADTTGDGVTDQWGFVTDVGMNRIGGWIYGNGGGYLTEDKSACMLDDPASVQALEFLTGMMFDEKVAPSKIELGELSAMDTFASGKAGMYVCGGWRVLSFRDITDFGWDIAPIPLSPNSGERGTVVDTVSWSVAKDTQSPEAAWELVKFFTGEAGQVRMAEGGTATPSMIEYASSEAFLDPTQPPAHRDVLISYTVDEIHYYPTIPDMGKMWDAWGQELSEMWLGQKSVQDSVTAFCERIGPDLPK